MVPLVLTVCSALQPEKAYSLIKLRFDLKDTLLSAVQPENALAGMDSTLSAKLTEVMEVFPANTFLLSAPLKLLMK